MAIAGNLQSEIPTLSADTADGRAMGSAGEKATSDFMISELARAGVRPRGDNNGWRQTFTVDDGRQITNSEFVVDDHALTINKDWFPLALCPAGEVKGSPAIALQESGVPWFVDLKETLENASHPGYDLMAEIRAKASACKKKGATALIIYNSSRVPDKLSFDPKDKPEPAVIPVVYLTHAAKRKYFQDESASVELRFRVGYSEKTRTGNNVVGFMDKGAPTTVVIASRYDNSSGLAGMIELARLLAASKLKGNNYLFFLFSGTGPGSPGSEYYNGHPVVDLTKVNYLLELGRLWANAESTPNLIIGGYHTSSWAEIGDGVREKKTLIIVIDSSATQGVDQMGYYRHKIPLLVLSTPKGTGDGPAAPNNCIGEMKVVKYIYGLIESAETRGRLTFTP
jgi:aminopeptidase YwaD